MSRGIPTRVVVNRRLNEGADVPTGIFLRRALCRACVTIARRLVGTPDLSRRTETRWERPHALRHIRHVAPRQQCRFCIGWHAIVRLPRPFAVQLRSAHLVRRDVFPGGDNDRRPGHRHHAAINHDHRIGHDRRIGSTTGIQPGDDRQRRNASGDFVDLGKDLAKNIQRRDSVVNISPRVPIDQQRTMLRLGQLHLFDEFDTRRNRHRASGNG